MFLVTFPCDVLVQVCCLIVSIPVLWLLSYFNGDITHALLVPSGGLFGLFMTPNRGGHKNSSRSLAH